MGRHKMIKLKEPIKYLHGEFTEVCCRSFRDAVNGRVFEVLGIHVESSIPIWYVHIESRSGYTLTQRVIEYCPFFGVKLSPL
jgi:hypothetical protein